MGHVPDVWHSSAVPSGSDWQINRTTQPCWMYARKRIFRKGTGRHQYSIESARQLCGAPAEIQVQPLIAICATGQTANNAVRKLRQAGFEDLYSVAGGINAWEGASLPLTRTKS